MSTKTYGSVGAIVGGAVGAFAGGGPVGAAIGANIGREIGTSIGERVNGKPKRSSVGSHLSSLSVQSSAYGENIATVYGSGRLAGNIIWSLPIKEVKSTTPNSSGGKGGGGQKATTNTSYNYYITMAVAICEGEVTELVRMWADTKIINQADYNIRFYSGSETQLPDSLIESFEGVGKTPAYRGLAYVVLEDFPIADYGNRIPNFTFEIRRNVNKANSDETPVEEMVKSIIMIPGAGEFVYDDIVQSKIPGEMVEDVWVQRGNITRINQNNRGGVADSLVALDQLKTTCPNVEWVAPVVCWFGDSVDAGECIIQPGVEFKTGGTTSPDLWVVAGYDRDSARQITLIEGSPQYGGTPSDASLLRYLTELKNRGYNIMFYPMMFMDVENKPWRGRVTGSAADVASFFTKTNGYNEMVMHYANLVKDVADAFVMASELVGLTSVRDVDDSFPAVDELVALAVDVKAVLDSGAKGVGGVELTYAADWSEYHHTNGGWYNLDPLWASPDIDMVGIDAYFPLTDEQEPSGGFSKQQLMDGWTEGEGYDWYYSDPERTTKASLSADFAWKNIAHWWSNSHVNPDSAATAWVPESKKIWFTEYGFPSVDGCSNQPNVFYDPASSESHFPYHSRGRVDFRAQRGAIAATEEKWAGSSIIERTFLWTWDARPFPFWPDLANVWADGGLWRYGHWVQGKFGTSSLAAIVADLSKRAGLSEAQIDVSGLSDIVEGYIIKNQTSIKNALDSLRLAYFFDAVESGGVVKYVSRGSAVFAALSDDDVVKEKGKLLNIFRIPELDLPQRVDVVYLNQIADYQSGSQSSQRLAVSSIGVETLGLPIVMSNQKAKNVADMALYNSWAARNEFEFNLPVKYAAIEPADVLEFSAGGETYRLRVVGTKAISPLEVKIRGVADDESVYDFYNQPGLIAAQTGIVTDPGETVLAILDLPSLPSDEGGQGYIRYAAAGKEAAWNGAVVMRSSDGGANYTQLQAITSAAIIGTAVDALGGGVTDIFDEENSVTICLYGEGELESMPELAVLNGANAALLGSEIIQFKNAVLVAENKYVLSGLLRGRQGTEAFVGGHVAGEQFVLLDNSLAKELQANSAIGMAKLYKGVSAGKSIDDAEAHSFTYAANALWPFSPVHIAGVRDGSSNLTVSWVRRTRADGQWRDYVDVPLGETSEQYEVEVMSGGAVVRTISGLTSPIATYSASDQIADFGSPQSTVSIRVYQLSEIVGRGGGGVAVV